jgi:acylphosphatase
VRYAGTGQEILGLTGWVRNNRDGTVELLVEADDEVHQDLERRLAEGPTWSRVDKVEAVDQPGQSVPPGFAIVGDGY